MNMYVVLSRRCKTQRAKFIAEEKGVLPGNLPEGNHRSKSEWSSLLTVVLFLAYRWGNGGTEAICYILLSGWCKTDTQSPSAQSWYCVPSGWGFSILKHSYVKHLCFKHHPVSVNLSFLSSYSPFFKMCEVGHFKCCFCFMGKVVPQDR